MKKTIFSLILGVLFSSLPLTVSAVEIENSSRTEESIETYYEMPHLSEEEEQKIVEEELKNQLDLSDNVIIKLSKVGEEDIQIDSDLSPGFSTLGTTPVGTTYKTANLGYAGNQTANGVYFNNGGYIYWQDGGRNVSVSFGLSGQTFSVGVSVGVKSPSVTGYGAYCKPKVYCKLRVQKDLKITRYYYDITDVMTGIRTTGYYNQATTRGIKLLT